jgi:hypothetical protein
MPANDQAPEGAESTLERQGISFLHEARAVRPLPPAAVERIARRLRKPVLRPRRMRLWPAWVALGLGMSAGATYAVAKGGLRALPIVGSLFAPKAPPPQRPDPPRGHRAGGRGQTAPALPPPGIAPAVVPGTAPPLTEAALAETPPQSPSTRPARPRAVAWREPNDVEARAVAGSAVAAPLAAGEDPIVGESHSFATVIESWHRRGDADVALALLEVHEGRYPAGHMRLEARVLRAELYLAQGRGPAALAVLDAISLAGIPRMRELQTLRGELRVKAGRCVEARVDLGGVLEKSVTDVLGKRAAQALARCP